MIISTMISQLETCRQATIAKQNFMKLPLKCMTLTFQNKIKICIFRLKAVQCIHSFYSGAVLSSGEPCQHPAASGTGRSRRTSSSPSHGRHGWECTSWRPLGGFLYLVLYAAQQKERSFFWLHFSKHCLVILILFFFVCLFLKLYYI